LEIHDVFPKYISWKNIMFIKAYFFQIYIMFILLFFQKKNIMYIPEKNTLEIHNVYLQEIPFRKHILYFLWKNIKIYSSSHSSLTHLGEQGPLSVSTQATQRTISTEIVITLPLPNNGELRVGEDAHERATICNVIGILR
jgi:hypothetical protein